jgi:uncharacterized protein YcfJ
VRDRISRLDEEHNRSSKMIRKTIVFVVTMAAIALSPAALAGHDGYRYAKVVDVEPVYRYVTVRIPEEECWTEVRYETVQRPRRRQSGSVVPTIAGGVIGGVVGRQFGSGNGRDAMTVLGTLIGASIGHEAGHRGHHDYDDYGHTRVRSHPIERCETHYSTREERELDGYRVTYRFAGREYTTRTQEHPGKRIRVRVDVTPAIA